MHEVLAYKVAETALKLCTPFFIPHFGHEPKERADSIEKEERKGNDQADPPDEKPSPFCDAHVIRFMLPESVSGSVKISFDPRTWAEFTVPRLGFSEELFVC